MIEIISGSLLDAEEQYIAHQCNCLTRHSAGMAKSIFDKWPHANTYANRTEPDLLGTIKILGDGINDRYVINMFAQYYPGKPKYPLSNKDGLAVRERYFHKCLLKVAKIPDLQSIAFPWRIGCNLGGGIWEHYLGTLANFANYVEEKHSTVVRIYRLDGDD